MNPYHIVSERILLPHVVVVFHSVATVVRVLTTARARRRQWKLRAAHRAASACRTENEKKSIDGFRSTDSEITRIKSTDGFQPRVGRFTIFFFLTASKERVADFNKIPITSDRSIYALMAVAYLKAARWATTICRYRPHRRVYSMRVLLLFTHHEKRKKKYWVHLVYLFLRFVLQIIWYFGILLICFM